MSSSSDIASRFTSVEEAAGKKLAEAKAAMVAADARHLAHFVFESLLRTAKAGRLQAPERNEAPPCRDCGGATTVVARNEDRASMGIYEKIESIHYGVCLACCTARELHGCMTDQAGRHWS